MTTKRGTCQWLGTHHTHNTKLFNFGYFGVLHSLMNASSSILKQHAHRRASDDPCASFLGFGFTLIPFIIFWERKKRRHDYGKWSVNRDRSSSLLWADAQTTLNWTELIHCLLKKPLLPVKSTLGRRSDRTVQTQLQNTWSLLNTPALNHSCLAFAEQDHRCQRCSRSECLMCWTTPTNRRALEYSCHSGDGRW